MKKIKLIWIIFSILLISLVWILALHDNFYGFDEYVFNILSRFHNKTTDSIMLFFTSFGSSFILILVCLIILFWFSLRLGLLATINLIISASCNLLLKSFFHRERPSWKLFDEWGFSFPSGHAMICLAFYGYIFYIIAVFYQGKFKKLYLTTLGVLILIIGLSRIYFGVHYFSDVIAGFLFAGIYLIVLIHFTRVYLVKDAGRKPIEKKD